MGRKKIQIRRIDTEKKRTVTFNKRRAGVIKKAMELSILCDTKVAVIIMDSYDRPAVYSSTGSDDLIQQVASKKPIRILDNQDYNTLFGDDIDEESATALERFRAVIGTARDAGDGADAQALANSFAAAAASIPDSAGNFAIAPNPLQALQRQILVHTAMQIGTGNASNAAQQAIQALQALQMIQAMSAQTQQPQPQTQPVVGTTPSVPLIPPSPQQISPPLTAAQIAQLFLTPGGVPASFPSFSQENQAPSPITAATTDNADAGSSGIPAPSFPIPLPTPGISAQLAELTALIAANTSTGSGNTPTGTPGPPSLNTSPSLMAPATEVPSLSPSTGSTGMDNFAMPLAPSKTSSSSGMASEMDPPADPMSASANSKRMSLTVSIPVENQFLSALLAQSNQQAIKNGANSAPAAAAASDAAPAASVGAAPESNVVASATMPDNRPLMTPSDWATQATPGATNWLLPQPSPMNLPMLTPGFGNTPSSAPFLSFPMFSPKH